jgi:putative colanic acid biosynthesis UDP-glucose lipid carrier transferase
MLYALDACLVVGGAVGLPYVFASGMPAIELPLALLATVLLSLSGEWCGIYRCSHGRSADIEVLLISSAWLMAWAGAVAIASQLSWGASLSNPQLLMWFLISGLMLLLGHMGLRAVFEWLTEIGLGARNAAVLGCTPMGRQIAYDAVHDRDSGLRLVGIFDDGRASNTDAAFATDAMYRGGMQELQAEIRRRRVDTIFIALPLHEEARIQSVLDVLADTTVSVYLIPNFHAFESLHSRWSHVAGHTVISVFETPIYGVDGLLKRGIDIALSLIGLILAAPIMLICALMIRLTSAGPVFFLQRRYGLDGKEFLVWKFRTMTTCDNGSVVKQAVKNDPRVTPVGRILRRTSLDELPQLFNVLAGSMSLVGPRPYATAHNEQFRTLIKGYMLRHKVKPGITGLAQVLGSRLETDTVDKMVARIQLDHRYIRDWSLWMDMKILLKTIQVVLRQDAH